MIYNNRLGKSDQRIRQIKLMSTFLILALIGGCSKTETRTQAQIVTGYMTQKNWSINTVQVDGVDATSNFAGMALSFTPTSFSTTNSNTIWPANGTWKFTDASGSTFKIDDQLLVTVAQASSSTLSLTLTWTKTTFAGGRVQSVSGNYEFQFR
jgi:hypothetical protein